MHALSIDSDHLRFSNLDGSLMLRTQVGFLAKNQLPSKAPDSIIIPRVSNYCKSDNFNHMLCLAGKYGVQASAKDFELLRFILGGLNHLGNIERDFTFRIEEIRI